MLKISLKNQLKQMAYSPKIQLKRLTFGTAIAVGAMLVIFLTSELENQWLFYFLVLVAMVGILHAIPGYIGIWMWRMRRVFFEKPKK